VTLHYHGTPITPASVLETLAGRNFCVSYAAPNQVEQCHQIGQSVMLDNGAYTFWSQGVATSPEWWGGYADWAERWLNYPTTWAVVPDVIDGDEVDNDRLILSWPRSLFKQSAPVWHMHESLDRLMRLCVGWDRVCIGSSAQYKRVGSPSWHRRMEEAMNRICVYGIPPTQLHMLRGMAMVDAGYPFASVDSTDVARNHNRPQNTALALASRWDAKQAVPRWTPRSQLELEAA
jgi:hypothetical protein